VFPAHLDDKGVRLRCCARNRKANAVMWVPHLYTYIRPLRICASSTYQKVDVAVAPITHLKGHCKLFGGRQKVVKALVLPGLQGNRVGGRMSTVVALISMPRGDK